MGFLSGLFHSRDKPTNSTNGSAYRFLFGGSNSGKSVNERSAMQMTAVYACVRILSESIAGLPVHVYQYTGTGGKEKAIKHAVMKELAEYADLATVDMKAAVKKAGNTVKKQIQSTAPKDTGAYSKSWSMKNTKETSKSLEVTVYSRNRYQLAHLLEFGHAKRGGGRVAGRSHIAPAEEVGIKELESEIERCLKNG